MIVTIVIPTHNRGEKLITTVERLLANDAAGFDEIEVIVVDDASTAPAAPLMEGLRPSPPLTLRCIRLAPNVGPAGARNAGFRCARGSIVLFVDDDILYVNSMHATGGAAGSSRAGLREAGGPAPAA